jgi:hypothetical protein
MAKTNRERLEASKVLTPGQHLTHEAEEAIEKLTPHQVEALIEKKAQLSKELKHFLEGLTGFTPIQTHHLV